MVRKMMCFMVACVLLITALCGTVNAASHSVYDNGSLSTTYITYFKDILSGADFNENYVAFRSGQYSYSLIVGELEYNNGVISGSGKEYKFATNSTNYNATYLYTVTPIQNFSVDCGESIIYSDLGDFPQLIERGAKYEMLQTLLIFIVCLCFVIRSIFYKR